MRVGSIVECVLDYTGCAYYGEICPIIKRTYTIREIFPHPKENQVLVRLEEIINKPIDYYNMSPWECGFYIHAFREIQFPDDLQEQIEECLNRELIER